VPELLNPFSLGRDAGRLALGALRLGTAPARATVRLLEMLTEDLLDAIRDAGPGPTHPPASSITPDGPGAMAAAAADAEPVPENGGPPAITPSIASTPWRRRRRTALAPTSAPHRLGPLFGPPATVEPPARPLPDGPESPASPDEPEHLQAEETLVAEAADPGAEEGAGAELHVEEPWHGYGALTAPEIVDRLAVQSEAALSVILLYERAHRARKSVLGAAERELARR
jgi:hypothetical protein